MVKLSVVIPVYNAEKFIEETVNSVLNQSLREIEVICVDDGSTDDSVSILKEIQKRDPRVQIIQQKNEYAGSARNKGIAAASGEYIHFLDADDYVLPEAYQAVYNKARIHDLDCLKFRGVGYDMQKKFYVSISDYVLNHLEPDCFMKLLDIHDDLLLKLSYTVWTGIFRTSLLKENNIEFNHLFCVNDRSFSTWVYLKAKRIMLSRDMVVVHRMNMSESLVGKRSKYFDCVIDSMNITEDILKDIQADDATRDLIMARELEDLLHWCRRYAVDIRTDNAEEILDKTRAYLDTRVSGNIKEYAIDKFRKILVDRRMHAQKIEKAPNPFEFIKERRSDPEISVIVYSVNHSDSLEETLYSLSRQTLENCEFICLAEQNDELTWNLVKKYSAIDHRFSGYVVDAVYGGAKINHGLSICSAPYVTVATDGMYFERHAFANMLQNLKREEVAYVLSDYVDKNSGEQIAVSSKDEEYEKPFENLQEPRGVFLLPHGLYDIRQARKCLEEGNGFDMNLLTEGKGYLMKQPCAVLMDREFHVQEAMAAVEGADSEKGMTALCDLLMERYLSGDDSELISDFLNKHGKNVRDSLTVEFADMADNVRRNRFIDACSSEYVCFNEELLKYRSKIMAALEADRPDVLIVDQKIINGEEKPFFSDNFVNYFSGQTFSLQNGTDDPFAFYPGGLNNKIFSRDHLKKNNLRFNNDCDSSDVSFVMKALLKADRISFNKDICIEYRAGKECLDIKEYIFENVDRQYQVSFVAGSILEQLENADEFARAYDIIKNEFIPYFHLDEYSYDYFLNREDHAKIQLITRFEPEQYLLEVLKNTDNNLAETAISLFNTRKDYAETSEKLKIAYADKSDINKKLQQAYSEKSEINAKLQQAYGEKSEINAKLQLAYAEKSEINRKLQQTYGEKSDINRKLQQTYAEKSEINKKLQQANEEINALKAEITAIKESRAYKLGEAVAYVPRKIRDGLKR